MHQIDYSTTKAFENLQINGTLRKQPEDFQVDEILGFDPSGHGEHYLVYLEKRGENTQWVAGQIAQLAQVAKQNVGYCGRKDRNAVTKQWFSVQCPGQPEPNWSKLSSKNIRILKTAQHHKKLKPGMHQGNTFIITLRALKQLSGKPINSSDSANILKRIETIGLHGVPNYFGPQRFGRNGNNLLAAQRWLEQNQAPRKDQRSMVLSSARALLFNQVLALRVKSDNWYTTLSGDPSSNHLPSGPLWGRGRSLAKQETLAIEELALSEFRHWCDALEHKGLQQDRRALVLKPGELECQFDSNGDNLILKFKLPNGCFATTLIEEIITTISDSHTNSLQEYESKTHIEAF